MVAEAMATGKRMYIERALEYLVTKGGSDLHLSASSPPLVLLHGALIPIPGTPELSAEDTQELLDSFLTDSDKKEEFARDNEVDFSFELSDVARFRVNQGRISMDEALKVANNPSDLKLQAQWSAASAVPGV